MKFSANAKIGEVLPLSTIIYLRGILSINMGTESPEILKDINLKKITLYIQNGKIHICELGEEPSKLLDCSKFKRNNYDIGVIQALSHLRDGTDGQWCISTDGTLKILKNESQFGEFLRRANQEEIAKAYLDGNLSHVNVSNLSVGEVLEFNEEFFNSKKEKQNNLKVKMAKWIEEDDISTYPCEICYLKFTSLCHKYFHDDCISHSIYFKKVENNE